MKVPQWFVPKRRLIKVAQDRVQETLQYVTIDNSVKPADRALLDGYHESLARFAQRHNIAINFKKAENSDITKMNVYRTSLSQHAIDRMEHGNWYFATPEYKASSELHLNNSKESYKDLKECVKVLAETDAIPVNKERYPRRIRHENKYFNWTI